MNNEKTVVENLNLTLTRKWFDLIASGEKIEEYREIKPYWFKRIVFEPKFVCRMFSTNFKTLSKQTIAEMMSRPLFLQMCPFNPFKTITFKNGYSSGVPEIVVECLDIKIRTVNLEHGAEDGVVYFVFELGEILSTKNLNNGV